jgi:hypothetical protein
MIPSNPKPALRIVLNHVVSLKRILFKQAHVLQIVKKNVVILKQKIPVKKIVRKFVALQIK